MKTHRHQAGTIENTQHIYLVHLQKCYQLPPSSRAVIHFVFQLTKWRVPHPSVVLLLLYARGGWVVLSIGFAAVGYGTPNSEWMLVLMTKNLLKLWSLLLLSLTERCCSIHESLGVDTSMFFLGVVGFVAWVFSSMVLLLLPLVFLLLFCRHSTI